MYLHSVVLDALLKLHGEHATRQVNAQLDTQLQDLDKAAEATKGGDPELQGAQSAVHRAEHISNAQPTDRHKSFREDE